MNSFITYTSFNESNSTNTNLNKYNFNYNSNPDPLIESTHSPLIMKSDIDRYFTTLTSPI